MEKPGKGRDDKAVSSWACPPPVDRLRFRDHLPLVVTVGMNLRANAKSENAALGLAVVALSMGLKTIQPASAPTTVAGEVLIAELHDRALGRVKQVVLELPYGLSHRSPPHRR